MSRAEVNGEDRQSLGDPGSGAGVPSNRIDWSVASWVRHPQLESILGSRLDELSFATVEGLVSRKVIEDVSIDFKRRLYAVDRQLADELGPRASAPETRQDRSARLDSKVAKDCFELAKDVSAFANTSGGLIVVGVADTNGRASKIVPVDVSDARRQLLLDVIRAWTTPYVSGIEIGFLEAQYSPNEASNGTDGSSTDKPSDLAAVPEATTEPGSDAESQGEGSPTAQTNGEATTPPTVERASPGGCLMIYVPASEAGPHAVREPNAHSHTWYLRDGGHCTPIPEPQVAVLYRDRFIGRDQTDSQIRQVFEDGVAELDRRVLPYLAVALVPSRKAMRRTIDRGRLDTFKEMTRRRQEALPGATLGHHAIFGRGRVVLRDTAPDLVHAKDHLLHLYADGRAFAAVGITRRVDDRMLTERLGDEVPDPVMCIRIADIALWTVALIGLAVGHAADAGGAGDVEIRCGIVAATEPDSNVWDRTDLPLLQHVVIEPARQYALEHILYGTRPRSLLSPVQVTGSMSIAGDARELVAVSSQIVDEIVAEFGFLPTDPVLTADGRVSDLDAADAALERLTSWAQNSNL